MSAPATRSPEVDAAGDKEGAAAIARLGKPNLSAWVINQLHRQAGVEVDALFAVAEQLREGDLSATGERQRASA